MRTLHASGIATIGSSARASQHMPRWAQNGYIQQNVLPLALYMLQHHAIESVTALPASQAQLSGLLCLRSPAGGINCRPCAWAKAAATACARWWPHIPASSRTTAAAAAATIAIAAKVRSNCWALRVLVAFAPWTVVCTAACKLPLRLQAPCRRILAWRIVAFDSQCGARHAQQPATQFVNGAIFQHAHAHQDTLYNFRNAAARRRWCGAVRCELSLQCCNAEGAHEGVRVDCNLCCQLHAVHVVSSQPVYVSQARTGCSTLQIHVMLRTRATCKMSPTHRVMYNALRAMQELAAHMPSS